MATTFRKPDGETEFAALGEILTEAFSAPPERIQERLETQGAENIRVLLHGDTVAGGLWFIPMGQFFGGRSVPLVGIAGVGVSPNHRGLGVAQTMMSRTIQELHDRGVPLSGLYPATQTLYRKSGYEACGHRYEINLRLDQIRVKEHGATVRRLTGEDRPAVEALYGRVAATRDGYLDRGKYLWDRVYAVLGETTRGYGVFVEDRLEGYVYILHRDRVGGFYHLTLTDFIFDTPRAGRRLLALLADHASMAGEVRWYGGPSDPALFLMSEQKHRAEFRFYWMNRITHLGAAMSGRGWPQGLDAELHLEIADDIVKAHNGRFVLRVRDGAGEIASGGRGDLELDIRDLVSLYCGFMSPYALRAAGRIQGPESALRAAAAAFSGFTPTMADMY